MSNEIILNADLRVRTVTQKELFTSTCFWVVIQKTQNFHPSRVAVCARNQMKIIKITSLCDLIEFTWGKEQLLKSIHYKRCAF